MEGTKPREFEFLKSKYRWYRKWWGILLLALAGLVAAFFIFVLVQAYSVYRQMMAGTFIPPDAFSSGADVDMNLLVDEFTPWIGAKDGKIRIVEFGDFNCPFTLEAVPALKQLVDKYPDKIKLYWRNYPVHDETSVDFAKAGVCAGQQQKFWAYHDRVFAARATEDSSKSLNQLAAEAGMDLALMKDCLNNSLTEAFIRKDYYAGQEAGVTGTPTFVINGFVLQGVIPLSGWEDLMKSLLPIYDK